MRKLLLAIIFIYSCLNSYSQPDNYNERFIGHWGSFITTNYSELFFSIDSVVIADIDFMFEDFYT